MTRRRPRGRSVNGIVVVDKPIGASSNHVLQQVKRLYGAAKAGHTGSLDPLATGVLPICLGEATKLSQYLLDSDKSYRTTAKLGIRTTTGDAEGEVVSERPVMITESDLGPVLAAFRGPIEQVPSMFSALKHNGKPLYEYARQGIEIERPARKVNIYRLTLIEFRGDELVLEVDCSKGTYIRTLVEDIGEMLGCGAHVAELRRLKAGPFEEEQSYTIETLEQMRSEGLSLDGLLLPQDAAVSHLPAVLLGDISADFLLKGQPVQVSRAPTSGFVRIYHLVENQPNVFLGIGEIQDDGLVAPKRLMANG